MSEGLLHFVEYELQIAALLFFAALYALKVRKLMKLPLPPETAPAKGSAARGVAASFAAVFYPWSMESTTKHIGRWVDFALYHLAAAAAIGATFTIPFTPRLMTYPVRMVFAFFIVIGIAVGFIRLARRMTDPYLRHVSTPDDYFSLAALQVFFASSAGCLIFNTPGWRFTYFVITALFLVYVPFSKISHYLYWFFARTYLGIRFGRRGVLPRNEALS
jgi:hypothetical protein